VITPWCICEEDESIITQKWFTKASKSESTASQFELPRIPPFLFCGRF
jgi:hypothetical protein